jgi:AP-3 complex subunit mu
MNTTSPTETSLSSPTHRRPVIQSGFRSTYAAYPLIHVDAVNDAVAKAPKAQDVDPIIYVPSLTIGEPPSACCHVLCNDTRLLCVISGNGTLLYHFIHDFSVYVEFQVDPLFAFAFVQMFVEILQEYFGTVSVATVRENADIVYQVRENPFSLGHGLLDSCLQNCSF